MDGVLGRSFPFKPSVSYHLHVMSRSATLNSWMSSLAMCNGGFSMRWYRLSVLILLCISALFPLACQEKKKTRSITLEGPDTKREIKIETTDKKKDKDKD